MRDELLERACQSIPGGVPGFHRVMQGADYPLFLDRGVGAFVTDTAGNRYLDFILGKGPIVLGYGDHRVQQAVEERIVKGNLLSMATEQQVRVAELLLEQFPEADLVRFHKSGSEACVCAVRIARAFTGRPCVLSSGYHGWHDWNNPGTAGVISSVGFADFHFDLDELDRLLDLHRNRVAAIFVEPIPGFLTPDFYRSLRAAADSANCLLLFDEVKTGFRVPLHSVQSSVQVKSDITTLSKAFSNGYCLSCVIGRADVLALADTLHVAGTFDIEATPFAAAEATLRVLAAEDAISRMARAVDRATDALNQTFRRIGVAAKAFPMGTMFRITFLEASRETFFYREMAREGVLLYPYDNQFVSLAHGEAEYAQFLETADRVLTRSLGAVEPVADYRLSAELGMHRFPHRKGFLAGAPGPSGRSSGRFAREECA